MIPTSPPHSRRVPGILLSLALLAAAGCGRTEPTAPTPGRPSPAATGLAAPDIPPEAPTVADLFPTLAESALLHARLVDLPPGILLRAEQAVVTREDLREAFESADPALQDPPEPNAFFLLEQLAVPKLLSAAARRAMGPDAGDGGRLEAYLDSVAGEGVVNERDLLEFHEANRDWLGEELTDELRDRIRAILLQGHRQQAIREHARTLGLLLPVALNEDWVRAHAGPALDNPVDQARMGGRVALVNFGAGACDACREMDSVREILARRYGDRIRIVYVSVNERPGLAFRYGVMGIPHLIFYDATGRLAYEYCGVMSVEQIEARLDILGIGRE